MDGNDIRCPECGSANVTSLGQPAVQPMMIADLVADNQRVHVPSFCDFRCECGNRFLSFNDPALIPAPHPV